MKNIFIFTEIIAIIGFIFFIMYNFSRNHEKAFEKLLDVILLLTLVVAIVVIVLLIFLICMEIEKLQ